MSGPTYRVTIQFANALNLPSQAKVMANGVQVGVLHAVNVIDPHGSSAGRIDAQVDIERSVALPASTSAQLRQNTILGDIFISLTTPSGDFSHVLRPGATIGLQNTKPAVQVEDVMSNLAMFISGGSMQRMQDMIQRMNSVLPRDPHETARIFDILGVDVRNISDDLDSVDMFLAGVQTNLTAVDSNRDTLAEILTQEGAQGLTADFKSLVDSIAIIGGFGRLAHSMEWLAPLMKSSDASAKALVPLLLAADPLDLSAPSNLTRLTTLLRERVIPFVINGPKINIVRAGMQAPSAAGGPVDDQLDLLVKLLRVIGAVR
ncbi:MlaD family protein [Nocardia nova]|uniref:MlaD family protein n=1 Tax=Nocardia nova TaxID=37330 RepID=UPI003400F425